MKDIPNTADLFLSQSQTSPDTMALCLSGTKSLTYQDLASKVADYQNALFSAGLKEGSRVVVLLPISSDFYKLLLALFSSAMVVILIDPSMGLRNLLSALKDARPDAIVSIDRFFLLRFFCPQLWTAKLFSLKKRGLFVKHLKTINTQKPLLVLPRKDEQGALVSFTSATTGRPKGANRTQSLLKAQMQTLNNHQHRQNKIVHMTFFPVVVLHGLCFGDTMVMPYMPSFDPQKTDPKGVILEMQRHGVSLLSSAPSFLRKMADFLDNNPSYLSKLKALQVLLVGGAPCYLPLIERLARLLPHTEGYVVYGSTEAEPISKISFQKLLAKKQSLDYGYCVGREVKEISLLLCSLPEKIPTSGLKGSLKDYINDPDVPGEVLVTGDHVLKSYFCNSAANRDKKISYGGRIWHRTGDVAVRDKEGDLWLMGRVFDDFFYHGKKIYPFAIEAYLNTLKPIVHSAIVELHGGRGAMVFLEVSSVWDSGRDRWFSEVLAKIGLKGINYKIIPSMPMDHRHRSKILRSKLKRIKI